MSVILREKDLKASAKVSLYLDIYQEGIKRKYEYLKLYLYKRPRNEEEKHHNKETKKLAENIRAKRELMVNSSRNGLVPTINLKANFFDIAQIICDEKWGSTKRDYSTTLDHFKRYLKSEYLHIGQLSTYHLEEFKKYLNTIGLKENTQFNYFAKIKTIIKEANRRQLIPYNPSADIKNVKVNPIQKTFLTLDEIQLLAKTPCKNEDVKKAFLFACNTGLRFSDVYKLTGKDIVNDSIQFQSQKTGQASYFPLNGNALALIKGEIDQEEQVFKIYKDISHCNKILREWAALAGIKKYLTFHVSRHSFATNLLILNTDISVVSKLLGHTTLKHTMIYAKVVDSLKNNAVHSLPTIEF